MRSIIALLATSLLLGACATDSSDSGSGSTPPPSSGTVDEIMLKLVNEARAEARHCGGDVYPAVPALGWNSRLATAAENHNRDMYENNVLSHTGSDGLSVGDRVNIADYAWSAVGENIASGQPDATVVMTDWLASAGHCRNIMSADFREMGSAQIIDASHVARSFWTQVFAAPR